MLLLSSVNARSTANPPLFVQGGPHEHQIAGVATQLKEVATPAFKEYAKQVSCLLRHRQHGVDGFTTHVKTSLLPLHQLTCCGRVMPLALSCPSRSLFLVQVRTNAHALAEALVGHGYKLATGGTDNHLILWDLRPQVRRMLQLQ